MSRPAANDDGFSLVEVTVGAAILVILFAIVGNYLVSAGRTVSNSTAHQDNNAAAQRTVELIDANVRYACNVSILAATLYVSNSSGTCSTPGQPACAEWYASGSNLVEKTSSGTGTVATGVSGVVFTGNASYNGLVTIQFNLRQPQDQAADATGATVNETVTAQNMPQPVSVGSALGGCP